MEINITAQLHVHFDNSCNFLNKRKLKSDESFLFIGENPDRMLSRIEQKQFIAKYLKTSYQNPRNQPRFHDAEMHVTVSNIGTSPYACISFLSTILPQWNALHVFFKQFGAYY